MLLICTLFNASADTITGTCHVALGGLYSSKGTLPSKIVSEYDQEIPQSQTADNPVAPRERAAQPSRDSRKTN